MPTLLPSGLLQFTILDLESEVIIKTENRTRDTARADVWLRDSLIEISSNPDWRSEFVELEIPAVPVNLTANVQEYAETFILPNIDLAAALDIMLWTDPPTNGNRIRLDNRDYQYADRVSQFPGQPTYWYRFGGSIGFVAVPDRAYQVLARAYINHPINDNVLNQTAILLPRDWNEILIYAAVERGFIELLEYEKAAKVHNLLYGDPKEPGRPGLVNGRKKKREKERWRSSSSLNVKVRPYGRG